MSKTVKHDDDTHIAVQVESKEFAEQVERAESLLLSRPERRRRRIAKTSGIPTKAYLQSVLYVTVLIIGLFAVGFYQLFSNLHGNNEDRDWSVIPIFLALAMTVLMVNGARLRRKESKKVSR